MSDVGLAEDDVWPDPSPGLGEAANAPTASTQAFAAHRQHMDGDGDHVLDDGAGSSRSTTGWQRVSKAGSMGIKAAKFGPINKTKSQQARAVSAFAEL